ncbi:MAG: PAS domain-containing protein [Alphaproteobacteria bacterium]|nr:PAS domain-containing protein [Alphaproteobacteria bacterium]
MPFLDFRLINALPFQWGLLAVVLLLLGGNVAYNLHREHQAALDDERKSLEIQAHVINENLSQELRATNAALQELIDNYHFWKMPGSWREGTVIHLKSLADVMPGIRTFVITDEKGIVQASNRAELLGFDVANRDFFSTIKQAPDKARLYISKPYKSVLNAYIMGVSRMIPGPKGEFMGVVNASLDPDYFRTLLGSVNYAPDMWTALAHGSGIQFVMMPDREGQTGKNLLQPGSMFSRHVESRSDENFFIGTTLNTGEKRMLAVLNIKPAGLSMDTPLVVAVGREYKAVFVDWRRNAWMQGMVFLAVFLSSIAALAFYQRRSRQFENERREAELALQNSLSDFNNLVTQIPVGVYKFRMQADGRNRFDYVSPRWCQLLDVKAHEVYQDASIADKRFHLDDYDSLVQRNEAAKRDKKPFEWEGRIIRGDGEIRWIHLESSPSLLENGDILWNGIQYDITERKHLDDELRRSNAELEQFAYVASHDLREPLRMVNSFVTLLDKRYSGKLDPQAREFIAFAKDGALRMDRLICDLLEYSRIGRRGKPHSPVNLDEVVDEALLNLKATSDAVKGHFEVASGLPTISGDHDELVRLFQNLIGNALKYHKPDSPPLVRLSAVKRHSNWIISVEDSGIGIAPEHLDRIFGIFQRLHGHGEYEGTGIGLAICKKIAERHKGHIWAESTPGQGSRFYVSLPESNPQSPSSPMALSTPS